MENIIFLNDANKKWKNVPMRYGCRAHQTRRLGRQSRLHGSEVAPTRPKSDISVALLFWEVAYSRPADFQSLCRRRADLISTQFSLKYCTIFSIFTKFHSYVSSAKRFEMSPIASVLCRSYFYPVSFKILYNFLNFNQVSFVCFQCKKIAGIHEYRCPKQWQK